MMKIKLGQMVKVLVGSKKMEGKVVYTQGNLYVVDIVSQNGKYHTYCLYEEGKDTQPLSVGATVEQAVEDYSALPM